VFDEKITKEQYMFARRLVAYYNFGMRGKGDGNPNEQMIGMLGQTVLADSLSLKRPEGGEGFDGGFDFTINDKRVDVKTMGRTTSMRDYYVHNFVAYQANYEVDYYIFTSINKKNAVLTVCGYIDKESFLKRATFYQKGVLRYRSDGTSFPTKAPLYEIKQTDLFPLEKIEDIRDVIR